MADQLKQAGGAGGVGDPAAQVKEALQVLHQKFEEAGMGKVEEFMDQIDVMMGQLKEGPGPHIKKMQAKFDDLLAGMKDPSGVGDGMGGCATWYAASVTAKLSSFGEEATAVKTAMDKLQAELEKPMKDVVTSLGDAVEKLNAGLLGLSHLPKLADAAFQGKDSPDDLAKVDMGPLNKAVAGADIDAPLKAILDGKGLLEAASTALNTGAVAIQEFIDNAPGTIKAAFEAPFPLCFLTQALMSEAPQLLTQLLKVMDDLQNVSLSPVIAAITSSKDTLANLDVQQIEEPVGKFLDTAKAQVAALDSAVKASKASSGGGGVSGAMKGIGAKMGF